MLTLTLKTSMDKATGRVHHYTSCEFHRWFCVAETKMHVWIMENKNSIHDTSVHNCIRIVYLLQALTCVAFKTRHMTYMLKRKKLLVAAALLSIMKDLN